MNGKEPAAKRAFGFPSVMGGVNLCAANAAMAAHPATASAVLPGRGLAKHGFFYAGGGR